MEERRSAVASGKTVEDAIKNGLAMLGLRRDEVDVEVITPGSRGVLGFGAESARVRLLVKAPPAPAPAEPKPAPPPSVERPAAVAGAEPKPAPTPPVERPAAAAAAPQPQIARPAPALKPKAARPKPAPKPKAARPAPKPAGPAAEATAGRAEGKLGADEVGQQVLGELLQQMGIRATIESLPGDDFADEGQPAPPILNLTGEDLSILIGRRGETLQALQYLVRLMVSHRIKHWTNLIVDVEGYRARRRRYLSNLALRMAEEVVRTGRTQPLEPMPPDERRVVHMALRNHPKVTTQSVGEGDRRKVTIIPRR